MGNVTAGRKHLFIKTRLCSSCGADIAGHLQKCPYCSASVSVQDLLPQEAYERTKAKLLEIEKELYGMKWSRRQSALYYLALLRVVSVPLMLSGAAFIIFHNWFAATVTFFSTGIIAFIRKEPAYRMFYTGYSYERKVIRKKYIPALNRLMKECNARFYAWEDVLLDVIEEEEYGEYSPLILLMDPVNE